MAGTRVTSDLRSGAPGGTEEDPAANRIKWLQAGGKTVVRVYATALAAQSAERVPNVQMLLYAVGRNGRLLGPLVSETGPLDVPLGPPFTTRGMRARPESARCSRNSR